MEVTIKGKKIEIEENSKPIFLKHLVSILFDTVTLFLLFFVLNMWLFSTGIANTYNSHQMQVKKTQDNIMLQAEVGEKVWVTDEIETSGYYIHIDEDTQKEYIVKMKKTETLTSEQIATFRKYLQESDYLKNEMFAANLHKYLITMLSCAISEIILFLIVPLANKRRATCGQLLFGISTFSPSRVTYAKWYNVLYRFLFVFIIESCALYLWTGIYTFFLVPIFDLVVMLINKNNRSLRDYVSRTMLIESVSYSSFKK